MLRRATVAPDARFVIARPALRAWGAAVAKIETLSLADALAIAAAMALPWSTSVTSILIAVWLIACLPTLDLARLRQECTTPTGGLSCLLWALCALGVLWADAPWADRLVALGKFHKLLLIPVLIAQFRSSRNGWKVVAGLLLSCTVLLVLSLASARWPEVAWWRPNNPGVPFRNQDSQSVEFTVCMFGLCCLAIDAWRQKRLQWAFSSAALAMAFLADILYVATSRAQLMVVAMLTVFLGLKKFGWKGGSLGLITVLLVAFSAWSTSPYLRNRIDHAVWELDRYEANNGATSIGLRLEWWRKSIGFIADAPLLGHGTGSIRSLFQAAATGTEGASANVTANPHNQILAVGIQLGFTGMAVLLAMWTAHFWLFRGSELAAWIGSVLVIQSMIGGLFTASLNDFTEGWLYVFSVGVLGGIVSNPALRASSANRSSQEARCAGQASSDA